MNGLHNLVTSGKVLYLVSDSAHYHALEVLTIVVNKGISDTPAWIVAKANLYARLMGKTPFVIYQGAWSILQRDFEREIIPMARSEGTSGPHECSKHVPTTQSSARSRTGALPSLGRRPYLVRRGRRTSPSNRREG